MDASKEGGSPLEAAAGAAGPETTKAFELLTDETRLAILLALWESHDPLGDEGVSFSELKEQVGIRDSGQFNYHLGKLKGQFVEERDGGYTLGPVGNKIVRAIIGGVGLKPPTLEPAEIDMDCTLCGAPTAITYQDGRLFQLCTECEGTMVETDEYPEGMLYSWRLDPA
ncbi:MAG: helix-turn-helix transcriptional regulator, partial [Gemmatimonadetes bacterium]|nr:helix-turn-helix transcriptional regulator [Gemmatimonadota bacterium]NIS36586.1 helix-turn-helix transcriptional regulator [Actinomycetota bacterium]NIU71076.1 helix-turn-helix transcriptional regulator [Actinomycetota bacterium]NIW33030.1 helix-turn-helix domain-containing protein [Actinomycetota bacterium]NIX25181.1 helix-turn-helix domain-containing protein [Actinomycetota bacterium]